MSSFIRIYHLSVFLRWYQLLKLLLGLFVGSIFSQICELSHRFLFLYKYIYEYKKRSSTE